MNRLTTNKDVSEMGMFELAHNSCYSKDEEARYRNYELDIDARELMKKLYDFYCNEDCEEMCDEEFDDWITEYMQFRLDSLEGLLAAFYTHIWAMADLRERLKEYEDMEEQERLVKLPCKVGDTVYRINKGAAEPIIPMCITEITIKNADKLTVQTKDISDGGEHLYEDSSFGKQVFFTKEEAGIALKAQIN